MFLVALCVFLVDRTSAQPPLWHDRKSFAQAIRQVKDGWTRAQVEAVLGKPDDIIPPAPMNSAGWVAPEFLCYGTDVHGGLPTLGRVALQKGKVLYAIGGYGEPPDTTLVSEQELRADLRAIAKTADPTFDDAWTRGDPLRLIKVANLLIPMGKEKGMGVLCEYFRVASIEESSAEWPFWLVRIMFTSKEPGGVFPLPAIGAISPEPPKNPKAWPTFPILMTDDVPFNVYNGRSLAGEPEQFTNYVHDHSKNWTIRKTMIQPSDNPFASVTKLMNSKSWPLKKTPDHKTRRDEEAWVGVLSVHDLVRTAYRMENHDYYSSGNAFLDLDKYAKEFAAQGCHWDEKRQMYVRRDGSTLPPPKDMDDRSR